MNTCTANLKGHEIQQKETQDMPNCPYSGTGLCGQVLALKTTTYWLKYKIPSHKVGMGG